MNLLASNNEMGYYDIVPPAPGSAQQPPPGGASFFNWLKLEVDKEVATPAHRAHPDSYVCAHLLLRMLVGLTINKAINISSKPVLMSKFSFGKHRNEPVSSLPSDYLRWILKSSELGCEIYGKL